MHKSKDELKKEVIDIIKDFANEKKLNVISSIDIASFYKKFVQDFFELFHKRKMNSDINIAEFEGLIQFIYDNKDLSYEDYIKKLRFLDFVRQVPFDSLGFVQKFSYINLYSFVKSIELASQDSNFIIKQFEIRA